MTICHTFAQCIFNSNISNSITVKIEILVSLEREDLAFSFTLVSEKIPFEKFHRF